MSKKIIIIGAGIAGLSAGCYLQMNGYQTEIFEMYSLPGGLCTSWKRKDYTFNGSIHWLVGTCENMNLHKIWEELHAIDNAKIVNHNEFFRIEFDDGEFFREYTDVNKLEEEMLRVAPEDEETIREFIDTVKEFAKYDFPVDKAPELYGAIDGIKFLFKYRHLLKLLRKWMVISIEEYSKKFKNENMKLIFSQLLGLDSQISMVMLLMTLAWMHRKCAGYPLGGSLEFAKAIEKRYISLGGKIHYNSKVSKIIVENNRAVGVKLEDGSIHRGDIIISAADGHYTIFDLLDGKYVNKKIKEIYRNWELFPALCQISIGVKRSFNDYPHAMNFSLKTPLEIDPENKVDRIYMEIYNFDPTLAPEGKTPIIVALPADYHYWNALREEGERKYSDAKKNLANKVIKILEDKIGNISDKIEVLDVATPVTYFRYTNNWKGSFEGWLPTPKVFGKRIKKTLPGLENFYMVGQWVEPGGGLPMVALSGRNLAQIICKRDGKKFKTTS